MDDRHQPGRRRRPRRRAADRLHRRDGHPGAPLRLSAKRIASLHAALALVHHNVHALAISIVMIPSETLIVLTVSRVS